MFRGDFANSEMEKSLIPEKVVITKAADEVLLLLIELQTLRGFHHFVVRGKLGGDVSRDSF